jgi:hypothetical protein
MIAEKTMIIIKITTIAIVTIKAVVLAEVCLRIIAIILNSKKRLLKQNPYDQYQADK